jgi:hypothetical protein
VASAGLSILFGSHVLKAIDLSRGNPMLEPKKTSNNGPNNTRKPIRQNETEKTGRRGLTMIIQAGESDDGAIREFINDCLAPILAERFMSEQEK